MNEQKKTVRIRDSAHDRLLEMGEETNFNLAVLISKAVVLLYNTYQRDKSKIFDIDIN